MNADHLSYQRATAVSVSGLAFQSLFAVSVLLYGIFGQDPAAMSGAYALLLGVPVWLALALVSHQHRLERLERMEAEALASSDAADASVFEDAAAAGENLQSGKLDWMHRWFLPALSVLLAAAFAGLGVGLFLQDRDLAAADPYTAPDQHGWALAIGVAVAVVGFVFARFVAGMAKQRVWFLLHAGAGVAVAAALVGAALFVAHFVAQVFGNDALIRYLPMAIDALMVLLGAEMALNFVLNLYRPRRAGEYLRPALDSRVLSFLAAPDRLAESISEAVNYQFGFDVSSTWFYRLVSRSIVRLLAFGLAAIWLMSAFAVVHPNEQGLVLRGGGVVRTVESGLVLKRPWPLERVLTFPTSRITEINAGSETIAGEDDSGPILWTTAGSDSDSFLIVRASAERAGEDPQTELALMGLDIPVHFRVGDLRAYLTLAQDGPSGDRDRMRRELLRDIASSVALAHVSRFPIESLLGAARLELAEELRTLVQGAFDRVEAGVEVVFVGLQQARPPRDAAPSFERVIAAEYARRAEVEDARADAISTLAGVAGDFALAQRVIEQIEALERMRAEGAGEREIVAAEQAILDTIVQSGGRAAIDLSRARRERWVTHMTSRAQAIRSRGRVQAFAAAPDAYKARMLVDAIQQLTRQSRVWVTPPGTGTQLDQTEIDASLSGFTPAELEEQIQREE